MKIADAKLAQQEVLQRRLGRLVARPVKARQHVETNRENLEPEEDDDEVIGLDHQERTRTRRERQDVEISARDTFAQRPVVRDQRREQ